MCYTLVDICCLLRSAFPFPPRILLLWATPARAPLISLCRYPLCAKGMALHRPVRREPIPLAEVLADFGLTGADWETMGKTPLPDEERGAGNG